MDEDSGFVTEKLAACIYAALRFRENDPAVVAAWDENAVKAIRFSLHLSHPYATNIRRGTAIPHPRRWVALAKLAGVMSLENSPASVVDSSRASQRNQSREFKAGDKIRVNLHHGKIEDALVRAVIQVADGLKLWMLSVSTSRP